MPCPHQCSPVEPDVRVWMYDGEHSVAAFIGALAHEGPPLAFRREDKLWCRRVDFARVDLGEELTLHQRESGQDALRLRGVGRDRGVIIIVPEAMEGRRVKERREPPVVSGALEV